MSSQLWHRLWGPSAGTWQPGHPITETRGLPRELTPHVVLGTGGTDMCLPSSTGAVAGSQPSPPAPSPQQRPPQGGAAPADGRAPHSPRVLPRRLQPGSHPTRRPRVTRGRSEHQEREALPGDANMHPNWRKIRPGPELERAQEQPGLLSHTHAIPRLTGGLRSVAAQRLCAPVTVVLSRRPPNSLPASLIPSPRSPTPPQVQHDQAPCPLHR